MCELDNLCRSVLGANNESAHLFRDVLDLLPTGLTNLLRKPGIDVDQAIRHVLEWSDRDGALPGMVHAFRSDILVAGIPCVDFSPMGARQRLAGRTFPLILAWAFCLRHARPRFGVVENVVGFPVDIVTRLLGDLYEIDSVIICPSWFSWPIVSKRRYFLLALRGVVELRKPFGRWSAPDPLGGEWNDGIDL